MSARVMGNYQSQHMKATVNLKVPRLSTRISFIKLINLEIRKIANSNQPRFILHTTGLCPVNRAL